MWCRRTATDFSSPSTGGRRVVYDVAEDIREIPAFGDLLRIPGLFANARLDSSRTVVVWNDWIDLPSDTILEYGRSAPF